MEPVAPGIVRPSGGGLRVPRARHAPHHASAYTPRPARPPKGGPIIQTHKSSFISVALAVLLLGLAGCGDVITSTEYGSRTETTSALCRDARDNNGDGLTDCDDPGCMGFLFCATATENTTALCQDSVDNDGDGLVDCDDPDCGASGSCSIDDGSKTIDSWGSSWDVKERAAATQPTAAASCAGLGARLPTVTELYRNNAASGSGDVGTAYDVNALWTLITNYQGNAETVQLSDGGVAAFAPSSAHPFRCIWPAAASAAFDASACHGPPGAECANVRRFYNMDAWDRPALDMVAASHECNFVNGSIPIVEDWTDAIHSGALAGTWGNWLWGGDLMYTAGPSWLLHSIVQFDAPRAKYWTFDSTSNKFGAWQWPHAAAQFRCIGKRSATEGVDPVSPACYGPCFSIQGRPPQASGHTGRRSPIWSDSANRPAANRAAAAQACAGVGGSLPTMLEFQELIHAGLPFAAGEDVAWLWTSSPVYIGYYLNLLAQRGTGSDPRTWLAANPETVSWEFGDGYRAFRCVWHQTFQALPPSCGLGQEPSWDGTQFACAGRVAGGGGFHDRWGNGWDAADRAAASLAAAEDSCAIAGARLPTPTELYRVRQAGLDPAPSPSVSFLWTNIPSYRQGFTVAEQLSTGTVTDAADASGSLGFRCIWPASRGNVFGGHACNGDPGTAGSPLDPCFRTGRHVTDQLDRPALYPASAAHECSFYGGFLTGLRSFDEIVRGGAPNGDLTTFSWLTEPVFAGRVFYQGLARWSGTGTTSWYWNDRVAGTASHEGGASPNRYRCVFNDLLR